MLEISRPDISCEEIVERKMVDRFIKLPIIPYLKLVPVVVDGRNSTVYEEINRPQIALINALNDPRYRFIVAALSRRLGKTYIANVIGQLVSLVPDSNILIMSPNFNLSSISFELQRRLIKTFDLELTRDNLKDRILSLSNGSEIRMGSVSTVDSSVGRSYDLIIFDEAALSDAGKDAFEVALRPTLDRKGAKAIFISTPRGKKNWFSEFYSRGWDPHFPEWCAIRADYTENSRMLESDVAEARRSMSKAKFEQEYMASFVAYEGQIFEVKDDHIIEEFEPHDGCEAFAGLDPGFRDPTAFIVIIYSARDDCYYIVDEYLEAEKTTAQHCAAFVEIIARWDVDQIFIDSAAPQFASDLAYLHEIATTKAKKEVLAGIASVQTLLGQRRLKILGSCVKTLAALDQYQWDQRETLTKEKPMHEHSHIPDAIRYALHTFTI